ncbi:MAG: hypothetical protein SPL54_08890, partial [Lachnospiraceae bacterium]|nr:hypothetical protein [Lachnospiraceae bacterium]
GAEAPAAAFGKTASVDFASAGYKIDFEIAFENRVLKKARDRFRGKREMPRDCDGIRRKKALKRKKASEESPFKCYTVIMSPAPPEKKYRGRKRVSGTYEFS